MSQVRYMPAALAALDDIATYTAETWGETQRDTYIRGLFTLCENISKKSKVTMPKTLELDGFVGRYGKHRVYWREADNGDIIIVHILHERMLPERHLYTAFEDLD